MAQHDRAPKTRRRRFVVERLEERCLLAVGIAEFPLRTASLGTNGSFNSSNAVIGVTSGYGADPNLYFTASSSDTNNFAHITTTTNTIGVYHPKVGGNLVTQSAEFPVPTINAVIGDLTASAGWPTTRSSAAFSGLPRMARTSWRTSIPSWA